MPARASSALTPALALVFALALALDPGPDPDPDPYPSPGPNSTLPSSGDVADSLGVFEAAMSQLRRKFGVVFWVPGNHEFWLRRDGSEGADSLEKWARLEELCARMCTAPALAMHCLCTACALPVCTASCARAMHCLPCTACALPIHNPRSASLCTAATGWASSPRRSGCGCVAAVRCACALCSPCTTRPSTPSLTS